MITIVTFASIVYLVLKDPQLKLMGPIIFVYITYMSWIHGVLFSLPSVFHRAGVLQHNKEFMDKLVSRTDLRRHQRVKTSGIADGRIDIKNISFSIRENQIHDNVCMTFPAHSFTCLVGPSGMGKSILMKLIVQFYNYNDGVILIDGQEVTSFDLAYLRKRVLYVEQNTPIFDNLTIVENIIYGTEYTPAQFREFLKRHNLYHLINTLYRGIGGLDSRPGVRGGSLSGGMKRFIPVLRALIKHNEVAIYLFDEPLTALDKNLRETMIHTIKTICKGKTVIIVSHTMDDESPTFCENVVAINNNGCQYINRVGKK